MDKLPPSFSKDIDNLRFQFFNFCEHPGLDGQQPMLYMNLGVRFAEGVSIIFYNVRLQGGRFINPYVTKRDGSTQTCGYLGPAVAQAAVEAWKQGPPALLQRWPLMPGEESWNRLCFDYVKMSRLVEKPYLVYQPEGPKRSRKPKGSFLL